MEEATWEVTENDRIIARDGVELQFRSLNIEEFINNEVEVIASLHAQTRFLQNTLNSMIEEKVTL